MHWTCIYFIQTSLKHLIFFLNSKGTGFFLVVITKPPVCGLLRAVIYITVQEMLSYCSPLPTRSEVLCALALDWSWWPNTCLLPIAWNWANTSYTAIFLAHVLVDTSWNRAEMAACWIFLTMFLTWFGLFLVFCKNHVFSRDAGNLERAPLWYFGLLQQN